MDDLHVSRIMTTSQAFFHPLDPQEVEVIFAPLHDPLLSDRVPLTLESGEATAPRIERDWCSATISWDDCPPGATAALVHCAVNRDVKAFSHYLACLNVPRGVTYRFLADFGNGLVPVSEEITGSSSRDEVMQPLRTTQGGSSTLLKSFCLELKSVTGGAQRLSVSWFGLRNQARYQAMRKGRKRSTEKNWGTFLLPEKEWGGWRFARGLLFDEAALEAVCRKASRPGWKQHFRVLELHAAYYMRRDPEKDLGQFLPTDDRRYIRSFERGKRPYHWEALTLAFVGLVKRDAPMIRHALRYMMCMAHTPNWAQSAEHRVCTSAWDTRCFMEEMTSTSMSLLMDWLDFALRPQTKEWLRQVLWDRGISYVQRDLQKHAYMRSMNQGAVFTRACLLGGLMLEQQWQMGGFVDDSFALLEDVLGRYVQVDGGVHEGCAYLSQTMQGTLPTIIAYHRSRGGDHRECIRRHFGKATSYVETMSGGSPGMTMPVGDSRTQWMSGDGIPILARLYPESAMARILDACLRRGTVFQASGTLARSGGLLGMVYGPDTVEVSSNVQPVFSRLPHTGPLSSVRSNGKRKVHVFVNGSKGMASHAHRDLGSFILTIDDTPVFVDRGVVEYGFSESLHMWRTSMHNTLTPVKPGGGFPDQVAPDEPVRPEGSGDSEALRVTMDLEKAWGGHFEAYRREFDSETVSKMVIRDVGRLPQRGRVAFHLHTPHPVEVNEQSAVVQFPGGRCVVDASWAEELVVIRESVDFEFRPINHVIVSSRDLRDFDLATELDISAEAVDSGTVSVTARTAAAKIKSRIVGCDVILGATESGEEDWFATHPRPQRRGVSKLDVTDERDWKEYFLPRSIRRIVADHLFNYMALLESLVALDLCHTYLRADGRLRIVVPDGNCPDQGCKEAASPPREGQKQLLTVESLATLLECVGFRVEPLEYYDREGIRHAIDWNAADGAIRGSRTGATDGREDSPGHSYEPLIVDAIKSG